MAERKTLARPYAEAVFALAKERNTLSKTSELLQWIKAVVADEIISDLVDDPGVPREKIAEVIADVCGERIDEAGLNFLRLLLENRRLVLMPEIVALFEQLKADEEGSVEAHVTSAYKLTGEQSNAIAAGLKKKLGREINLVSTVDKSLVGGVVIRAGDLIIDGSVKGYLRELSSQLNH
ncbi:MAG: F0F1 ATP synthase subunit delta [Gammaproteobacteria bacterium]|nr:F0F1 ATP synthase subunit delta [Gammaproteobacteria bacterium]